MDYVKEGKKQPKRKKYMSKPEELVTRLKKLLGKEFHLTGKPRTDGSNFRKMVTECLLKEYMPVPSEDYDILPPKGKGVPTFLREYIDTYVVTTGNAYNLQVWNRNPNSESAQVDLKNGEQLLACDVRFVLGKISSDYKVESIVIMTPDYIERKFGKFGKPTIKQQLIISSKKREEIIKHNSLVVDDVSLSKDRIDISCNEIAKDKSIKDDPDKVLPIHYIDEVITDRLLDEN